MTLGMTWADDLQAVERVRLRSKVRRKRMNDLEGKIGDKQEIREMG